MLVQEGHNDDAQSLLSVQTTTSGLPVGWLLFPNNISDNKYQDILDCLEGTPDERISLWKLRELALSPGGLLCPQIRKRAWPMIILGCQQQIFLSSLLQQPPVSQVTPSPEDLQALERDIEKTLWNVEEHLMSSKLLQQQQEEAMKRAIQLRTKQTKKRVSFALPLLEVSESSQDDCDADNVMNDQHSPSSLDSNESSGSLDSPQASPPSEKDESSVDETTKESSCESADCTIKPALKKSPIMDSTISTEQVDMFHDDDISTVETQGTDSSFTISSRLARWRDASRQEQKVLFNVVASVLRMTSNSSTDAYFEDDAYHYVKGLHDVAAILMINLESPSLTTCIFQQLAALHFRDAMRPSNSNTIAKLMEATLPTLLRQVDPILYELLLSPSNELRVSDKLSQIRSWLTCWFTQDTSDLRVASRLMDVLLVSHPLMSVYLVVAIWTVQRESLLFLLSSSFSQDEDSSEFRGLAAETLTVEQTEDVIVEALELMKQVPPATLIQQARSVLGEQHANSISLLQPGTPAWTTRNECWTEWALWRRVREFRQTGEEDQLIHLLESDATISASKVAKEYPLAWTAIGGVDDSFKKIRQRRVVLIFGAVCLVVLTGMVMPGRTPSTTLPRSLPKISLEMSAPPSTAPIFVDTKECTTSVSYPWMDLMAPGITILGASHENNVVFKVHSKLQSQDAYQKFVQNVHQRASTTQNRIKTWTKESELAVDTVIHKFAQDWTLIIQRSKALMQALVCILASHLSQVKGHSLQFLTNFSSILEKDWMAVTNWAVVLFGLLMQTSGKWWFFLKNDSFGILEQALKQAPKGFQNVLMEQSWALQAEKSLTRREPIAFPRPSWLSDLRNEHFEPLWWKNLANEDFKTLW